jgi:hypothetical protein
MSDTELQHSKRSVDPVVRLIVTHWVIGAALGITCAAAMLWLDVAGLGTALVGADHVVWEGLALLFGGFACTFGGVVAAGAVMTVPCNDDGDDGRPGCARDARSTVASLRQVHLLRQRKLDP